MTIHSITLIFYTAPRLIINEHMVAAKEHLGAEANSFSTFFYIRLYVYTVD